MLGFRTIVTAAIVAIALVVGASGQTKTPAPKAPIAAPRPAPAPSPAPVTQAQPRVVVVEPIRIYDPLFDYPFLYTYPPEYMNENFGYVKIDTKEKEKDASVYVDGGFADKLEKARKFALKPGTHDIELRDSDGRVIYQQRVAVLPGKTTTLHVG